MSMTPFAPYLSESHGESLAAPVVQAERVGGTRPARAYCHYCAWMGNAAECVEWINPFSCVDDLACPCCGELVVHTASRDEAKKIAAASAAHGKRSAGAALADAINLGVQGHPSAPALPVPVGNTGTNFENGANHA